MMLPANGPIVCMLFVLKTLQPASCILVQKGRETEVILKSQFSFKLLLRFIIS